MSRNRRDDGPRSERSAEQRERDRLEREARRAGDPGPGPGSGSRGEQVPPSPESRERRTQRSTDEPAAREPRRRAPRGADTPDAARRKPPPSDPLEDRAARRRAAARGRGQQPLVRIQPDPPAPPAAPAGELGDDLDRPIGIRRVRRAVAPRTSRTIVTPPGDVPAGPARARRSPGARVGAILALLLLAAVIIGVLMLFQPFGSAQGESVRVTIPSGASAGDIGKRLADAGVVSSSTLFSIRATLAGKRAELRSGRHTLRRDMTYGDAIAALSRQPVATPQRTIDVTIPEGPGRSEVAAIVRKAGVKGSYLSASRRFSGRLNPFRYGAPKGTRSTEGFLFPATYELKKGAPAKDLVGKQLAAFADNFASVDLSRAKRKNLTAYDVLIIASMVEREAQLASERPLIAAVMYNRLKNGIKLGIDATIRYALNNWSRPLKQSELDSESPYNTRKRSGLPPTPIGNPGLASIRAAAKPANVDYLYYVVKPGTCGRHAFSSTDAKFQADSQRYNRARNAAGGKSPTTC
jgi:UPF0755 protein